MHHFQIINSSSGPSPVCAFHSVGNRESRGGVTSSGGISNQKVWRRWYFKVACQLQSLSESECEFPRSKERRRVFFLDVHSLCYHGSEPRPSEFIRWIKLLFSRVTNEDPIIAVMDGERGNDYRRRLLPAYKENRNRFVPLTSVGRWSYSSVGIRCALPCIEAFLWECNVPVVKVEDAEADDVVATLVDQVLQRGVKTVIASPDKDFKQLVSENVQLAIPMPELRRWSFYTLKHYTTQYGYDPSADLSLRSMMGDESDNIPGLAQVAPGFGRKTAVKLLKKHCSLENLLNAAAVRTVGKPYVQDALTKHASFLRRNLQVLALRRDVAVTFEENWCHARDNCNDVVAISKLEEKFRVRSRKMLQSLVVQ